MKELINWLEDNGFDFDKGDRHLLRYIKDDWTFLLFSGGDRLCANISNWEVKSEGLTRYYAPAEEHLLARDVDRLYNHMTELLHEKNK